MAALVVAPVQAQQTGTITGRVISSQAQPLQEVVVRVTGQDYSGLTTADGRYIILAVPAGTYTLNATYIGYGAATQEVTVPANGSATADFTLQARAVQIEGVVVTGTAIASQRREIGNSIDLITSAEIEASGVNSVEDLLRGRIQGLTVSGSSATPGVGSEINIRGLTSINGRTTPLFYLDGVRIGSESGAYETNLSDGGAASVLQSISLADIDRVEVIKGAAASTLYGTDAAAGVIQIFTKKGQPGDRAQWTLSTQASLVKPSFFGPGEDIDPTGLHLNRCDIDGPLPAEIPGPDPDCPASGSWVKNAVSQNHSLQVRGGSQDFTYFASGGFERQGGITNVPEEFNPERADNVFLRANFGFNPFENLQIQINNSYTNREIDFIPQGSSSSSLVSNVTQLDQGEAPEDRDALVFLRSQNQVIDQFTTSASINWTPMDNMRHRFNVGFDQSESTYTTENKRGSFGNCILGGGGNGEVGCRSIDIETNRQITLDYAGSLLWQIPGLAAYDFTTSWGGQLNDRQHGGLRGDAEGFINAGNTQTEQANDIINLNEDYGAFINGGFFAQQQIGWNNQVFVTAGARLDSYNTINARLESVAEYQVFPKLQGTYTVSDHSWFPSDVLETFRLRAAWGVAGDPPSQTSSRTLWDIRETGRASVGYAVDQVGNIDVGPERTNEFEYGLDASAFNGRVNLSGQYFTRKTTDGIVENDPVPSQGIIEPTPFNAGEWKTWGYEATLDVNVVEMDNFRWNVNTTYQFTDNEVLSIGSNADSIIDIDPAATGGFQVGLPFPAILRPVIENAGAVGELPIYSDTLSFIGVPIPPKELSINTSFGIGSRLNIDLFGYGQFGHMLVDRQALSLAEDGLWAGCTEINNALIAWREAGSPADGIPQYPVEDLGRCDVVEDPQTEDWYDEGDFFRFSSASAQYRLPESWLPDVLTGATVQFRVQNLNIFTDFNGTDPDAIRGAGTQSSFRESGYVMPLPRTYQLNLRLNF